MAQTVEELLAEVKRLKTAQAEHERLLLNEIADLKNEISDLKEDVIPKLESQLKDISERQKVFTLHLNQLYNSQTIEQQIEAMTNVAKSELMTEQCNVYSIDPSKHQIFTLDENGDRSYITAAENLS